MRDIGKYNMMGPVDEDVNKVLSEFNPLKILSLSNIKHQYKILKELHGASTPEESLKEIVAKDFSVPIEVVEFAIDVTNVPIVQEYGAINGRFQPPHHGHLHIINEVLLDGRIPIIIMGEGDTNDKNPLTIEQRKILIKLVYPNTQIIFVTVNDNDNWSDWFDDMGHALVGTSGRHRDQVILYYNNKEVDRYDYFEVYGKEYYNEFYTKIFEDNGIRTQKVAFVERTDIVIDAHATNIRDNIEAYKHLLDARIYWKLKEWGW